MHHSYINGLIVFLQFQKSTNSILQTGPNQFVENQKQNQDSTGRFGMKNLPKRLLFFTKTYFPKRPVPVENFRTFVIHSRNQKLGGFDEDRLCPIFWVPSREFSCSFVKLNHFSSAFVNETSSKVSEKIVVRKSLAPKAEAKKREMLILMRMTPQDHPFQLAEPAEYSKYRPSSHYTLWKARRVRFCQTFPRELDD